MYNKWSNLNAEVQLRKAGHAENPINILRRVGV